MNKLPKTMFSWPGNLMIYVLKLFSNFDLCKLGQPLPKSYFIFTSSHLKVNLGAWITCLKTVFDDQGIEGDNFWSTMAILLY